MKQFLIIICIISIPKLLFAQDGMNDDAPEQKEQRDLKFSDVEVETTSEDESRDDSQNASYRTLEIRYTTQEVPEDKKKITIQGHDFRCFESKKSAMSFYQMIRKKQDTPDYVIYYVQNEKAKKPEVYTFRVD